MTEADLQRIEKGLFFHKAAARGKIVSLIAGVRSLHALLREAHAALFTACGTEDGLDCSEGYPLMQRIEAAVEGCVKPEGLAR